MQDRTLFVPDMNIDFDNCVNLHRIIGGHARKMLLTVADSIMHEQSERGRAVYPSILLYGRECSGRRTFARALANTLCVKFVDIIAEAAANYFHAPELFLEQNSVLFVNSCDDVMLHFQELLYKIIMERKVYVPNMNSFGHTAYPFTSLLVIGVRDPRNIIDQIGKNISVQCKICEYTSNEIYSILRQRCQLLRLGCEAKALRLISSINNLAKALKILEWAYRVSRSDNVIIITEEHVSKAMSLMVGSSGVTK